MRRLAINIMLFSITLSLNSAVQFDADGEDYTRTSGGFPSTTNFSITAWGRIDVDRNAYQTIIEFCTDPNGEQDLIGTQSDGTTMSYWHLTTNVSGPNMTVGTWYFLGVTKSGANVSFYYAVNTSTSLTVVTLGSLPNGTAYTYNRIGESEWGNEWLNGSVAAVKVWDGVVLTQAEIEKEWKHIKPQRTQNLHQWIPLIQGSSAGVFDFSGNGRNMTGGAASATTDNPPIGW